MIHMSLARIMYGTNDDVHAPYSINRASSSARSGQSAHDLSGKNSGVPGHSTLGGMLRRAWAALTAK
jgi:hypothetical protein